MDLERFKASIHEQSQPDPTLPKPVQALWWDGKGDWEKAHQLAQDAGDQDGAWVHAYLHRKEGDEGNASYWYSRARKTKPDQALQEEWQEIAQALLP